MSVCMRRNTKPPGFACTKPAGHWGNHAWVEGAQRGVENTVWRDEWPVRLPRDVSWVLGIAAVAFVSWLVCEVIVVVILVGVTR